MNPTAPADLPGRDQLDQELATDVTERDTFVALVARLSRQSVEKHYNPFVDIDWDAPEMSIDVHDPRWISAARRFADLDTTGWYESLSDDRRAELGVYSVASKMKLGLQFENVLKRGLLEYTMLLPNGAPEFRYLYHETIEEAYHGLMFQEFVNRSGLPVEGMPPRIQAASRFVVMLARRFPSLFFMFVLGGEDPIDHQQREVLREGDIHPLLERIMRIHVTEEARHLSFARHHLKQTVPALSRPRRAALAVATPVLLGIMAAEMLNPSSDLVRYFHVPRQTVRDVARGPEARASVKDALRKVRRLCVELGLVNRFTVRIWKRMGIWDETPIT